MEQTPSDWILSWTQIWLGLLFPVVIAVCAHYWTRRGGRVYSSDLRKHGHFWMIFIGMYIFAFFTGRIALWMGMEELGIWITETTLVPLVLFAFFLVGIA